MNGPRTTPGWAASALLAVVLAAQPGCSAPCDEDPLGCGEGGEFMFAPSCELTGALEVGLGEGQADFAPLTDGQEPTVHEGSQGGRHLWVGLQVADPALEYPTLKIAFRADLRDPERCDESDPDCDPWVSTGQRDLVLGPDLPLNDEGDVEQTGILLIISIWPTDLERRLRLEVVDPCGREGLVEHLIPPASSG